MHYHDCWNVYRFSCLMIKDTGQKLISIGISKINMLSNCLSQSIYTEIILELQLFHADKKS